MSRNLMTPQYKRTGTPELKQTLLSSRRPLAASKKEFFQTQLIHTSKRAFTLDNLSNTSEVLVFASFPGLQTFLMSSLLKPPLHPPCQQLPKTTPSRGTELWLLTGNTQGALTNIAA